ncbi:MAG: hypothetical protein QOE73_1128 [Verrucomicrobiota bacterium]
MTQIKLHPDGETERLAIRALTLEERLRLAVPLAQSDKIGHHPEAESLGIWRARFNRGRALSDAWPKFLAENGLDERKLLRLTNISGAMDLPWWVETLRRLERYLQSAVVDLDVHQSVSENMAAPLVRFAWSELVTSSTDLRALSPKAQLALRQSLLVRLVRSAAPSVNWEVLAAKATRNLSVGSIPRNEIDFLNYFFSAGVAVETRRFLGNYPALTRFWVLQIEQWRQFVTDFLKEAIAFASRFPIGPNRSAPIISSVAVDLSDPHEGNRTVVRVNFGKKNEWFYKPRSGLQERAWFELLAWTNQRGFPRPFQIVSVQCQDRQCWMESVSPRDCRNQKEIIDFCFRLGALMCLVHVLRGVDFHPANLIASGDQPIIVDCETLLHPATFLPDYARAEEASIVRTGMLSLLKNISTMATRMRHGNGEFFERLIEGFRAMHAFLRTDRSALSHLKKWTKQLAEIPSRKVYRPTVYYYQLLEQSLAPSLLTSGLDRTLFLHAACRDEVRSSRQADAEITALENADIPVFRRRPRRIDFDLTETTLEQSISMIRRAGRTGG